MPRSTRRSTRTSLLAVLALLTALVLALVLAGCGGGSDTAGRADHDQADHDQADVTFAQGMVPHHAQAVVMADQAETTSTDPAILALAARIKAAQAPEITTMTGWLQGWDEKVPATDGSMAGMPGMEGMMSADQMSSLDTATGADFDRLWLQLMLEHHRGAIAQATTEKAEGRYPAALKLADAIITSQQAEVAQMEQLLAR